MSSSALALPTGQTVPAAPTGRTYIPALDGLRVLACLGVWAFHAVGSIHKVKHSASLSAVLSAGRFGVPIFFVLSAFLITRLLLLEKERSGRVDLVAYYVRRTLRIWPLYFVVSVAGLALARHFSLPDVRGSILPLATFTANIAQGHGHLTPTLGPLWSLAIEEQFYLVWPLILAFATQQALLKISWAMIAFAFVTRLGITLHENNFGLAFAYATSHTDCFALGTLIALNYDRLPSLRRLAGTSLLMLCLGAMVVIALIMSREGPNQLAACLTYTLVPFICAAIMIVTMGTVGIFLARPKVAYMGRFSYGVYMWHMMPIVVQILTAGGAIKFLATLPIAIVMAVITYFGIERPFLNLKHRFNRVTAKPLPTPS